MSQIGSFNLSFDSVAKSRGQSLLFSNLSFSLNSGQILWIHGANGSGKTTILRLAAGLSRADEGAVRWSIDEKPVDARILVAYQGHQDSHKSELTVYEELAFWHEIFQPSHALDYYAKATNVHERMHVPCGQLSAGQKRRLAISRLMMSEKALWVMDEPIAAMDKNGQAQIHVIMSNHINNGGSILAASHNSAQHLGGKARRIELQRQGQ